MATSKVDICNKALGFLGMGSKLISSLTENSNRALALNSVYGSVRDAVLRSHDWGFARMVEALAQLSSETIPGWTYLYIEPALCLRPIIVFTNTDVTNPDPVEYMEVRSPTTAQRALACNDTPAYIKYTYQVDDPALYPADFIMAFALALAAETAYSITGSLELGPKLQAAFGAAVSEAKRANASGRNVEPSADNSASSYEDARA